MTGSPPIRDKQARNRERRLERIREWAAYVRTHPDEDWGEQVNTIVDAQLQSARHFQHSRPDPEDVRASPLVRTDGPRSTDGDARTGPRDEGDDPEPADGGGCGHGGGRGDGGGRGNGSESEGRDGSGSEGGVD